MIPHRWPGRAIRGVLVARPNRFLALVRLAAGPAPRREGLEEQGVNAGAAEVPERGLVEEHVRDRGLVEAHVPDRGRALDLLVPGREVALVAARSGTRRTQWTCLLARSSTGAWVSLDPAGAPRLVEAALREGLLAGLAGWTVSRREVAVGASRIDLELSRSFLGQMTKRAGSQSERGPKSLGQMTNKLLCEVKSVGAAQDGVALFPDAPTERGVRHVALLTRLSRTQPCAIVLCAQRGDVHAVACDASIDPDFATALRRAAARGVRVVAMRASATLRGMHALSEIPMLL